MARVSYHGDGHGRVEARHEPSVSPQSRANSPLIAVVDDDDSFRTAVGRLLRQAGFRTVSFASAEDFLRQATGARCLVLDLHLGGMSGLELQARLAADHQAIPIIFVTAMEDPVARRRALGAGAVAYLEKPFDEGQLLDRLHRLLGTTPGG
jgi:FixJ family two-component response regulator